MLAKALTGGKYAAYNSRNMVDWVWFPTFVPLFCNVHIQSTLCHTYIRTRARAHTRTVRYAASLFKEIKSVKAYKLF